MIVLITKERSRPTRSANQIKQRALIEKTSFASNTPGSPAVKRGPRLRCSNGRQFKKVVPGPVSRRPAISPNSRLSTGCVSSSRCQINGGRRTENRERITALRSLSPSQRRALPKSARRNLFVYSRYRTSVFRSPAPAPRLVEPDGIEPTTSCLQSTRSPN